MFKFIMIGLISGIIVFCIGKWEERRDDKKNRRIFK